MLLIDIKASEIAEVQKTRAVYVQELANSNGNAPVINEIKERIQYTDDRIDWLMSEIKLLDEIKNTKTS